MTFGSRMQWLIKLARWLQHFRWLSRKIHWHYWSKCLCCIPKCFAHFHKTQNYISPTRQKLRRKWKEWRDGGNKGLSGAFVTVKIACFNVLTASTHCHKSPSIVLNIKVFIFDEQSKFLDFKGTQGKFLCFKGIVWQFGKHAYSVSWLVLELLWIRGSIPFAYLSIQYEATAGRQLSKLNTTTKTCYIWFDSYNGQKV